MATLVKKKSTAEEIESFEANTRRIAHLCAEKKAKNIIAFDVRKITLIADAFVICSATSEPQFKAIFSNIKDGMRKIGVSALRTEGSFSDEWLLMDYGDILVHIFREHARLYYDLESMWGDSREIPLDLDAAPETR
ncbi:MAG: ribosome silencing factor [Candidatus Hydrogenedentes bacterium]|nr:ribosome silencing factor [Candidatus Hydrogenedentota bacterium]